MAAVFRKMVKTQPLRLSPATMEVLAIVAYKQPVTKDELDKIRGVDCGYVLRNLMEKRLIRIAGRSDLPGKPMVYGTTHEFLELFNLKDENALPPLHEVEAMVAASEVGFEEKTQTVMEEFGKMVASSEKVLFDDSKVDEELESLRSEIANISTSTPFIEEQKAKEKILQAGGSITTTTIVSDSPDVAVQVTADAIETTETTTLALPVAEHQPSAELEAEAEGARMQRHAEMIAQALSEASMQSEVAVVNAEALVNAIAEEGEPELESEA